MCLQALIEDGTADPTGVEQAAANPDPTGRKMLVAMGRKMLGELELSGSGVNAGDSTAGASANAFGHGNLNGVDDSHIEVDIDIVDSTCCSTASGMYSATAVYTAGDFKACEVRCAHVQAWGLS